MSVVSLFFGWPSGGVWSNLVASVIWAVPSAVVIGRKMAARHAERIAQAARHHGEVLAGQRQQAEAAAARHEELVALAVKHHQEQLDRADVHAAAVQAHVTQAVKQAAGEAAGTLAARKRAQGGGM